MVWDIEYTPEVIVPAEVIPKMSIYDFDMVSDPSEGRGQESGVGGQWSYQNYWSIH